ncbi:MAG: hypothetical protein F2761_01305 [Actinobacteria bacterium]|uniref:Unannotated protein n=1 Tax=freshwater metagenome TaxID=449393 RepID=A0A6J7XYA1_9ZZZZ|nr:hypothetical protein [Actinomycetota bacterium]MSX57441.1 hypothetical protein [Actinomycetota bacterium]
MKSWLAVIISAVMILTVVLFASRKLGLSARYERTPRSLNPWNSQDKGIDPSDEV